MIFITCLVVGDFVFSIRPIESVFFCQSAQDILPCIIVSSINQHVAIVAEARKAEAVVVAVLAVVKGVAVVAVVAVVFLGLKTLFPPFVSVFEHNSCLRPVPFSGKCFFSLSYSRGGSVQVVVIFALL